ncbi:hypothetical protein FGB62_59g041 [Gracilaria domingensis]|nr:hypothetical protein FGB62_59g041 [Gracilaria domingensis]
MLRLARLAIMLVSMASASILCILCSMVITGSLFKEPERKVSSRGQAHIRINHLARQKSAVPPDVERKNITIVLEYLQFDYESGSFSAAPWMYTASQDPFVEDDTSSSSVLAHTHASWNANGTGNGSCPSGGNGKISRGYIDPFHFHANVSERDFSNVTVELRNLTLSTFDHINTVNGGRRWDIVGQAGDSRLYTGGTFSIHNNSETLLSTRNVRWHQNISYPSPIGEAPPGDLLVGAYFTGEIDVFESNDEWVRELDPHAIGFVLGLITAAAYGPSNCFSVRSFWVTLRGFPDLKEVKIDSPFASDIYNDSTRSGAKQGSYSGSTPTRTARAKLLGTATSRAATAAVSSSVGGAVGSMSVSVGTSASAVTPPGQGVSRMLTTASFFARINEIHGFHSDAMSEFGESMKPFVGKFPFPGMSADKSKGGSSSGKGDSVGDEDSVDLDVSVSDSVFAGCALYTSIIVMAFILLHTGVWFFYRRKSGDVKIKRQAWLIYMSSIAMSYVYAAVVLNASQYLRSHWGRGSGRPGFYAIAFFQLLFIGIGFTGFVWAIVFYALRKLWREDMKWVPRIEISDPTVRRAAIRGEYTASDNDAFHTLFECYYSSLAGPRVWLAGIELFVVLVDSVCTAAIWNEVIVLGILIGVYSLLFVLFFSFAPYVDKIEGRIVTVLGLIDLMVLVVEFMGALGDYETAEQMDYIAVILGFVSISLAILSAIYCDLIPMAITVWGILRRKLQGFSCLKFDRSRASDSESEWSFIQGSWTDNSSSSGNRKADDSDAISNEEQMDTSQDTSDGQDGRIITGVPLVGSTSSGHGPLALLSRIFNGITGRGNRADEEELPVVVRMDQVYCDKRLMERDTTVDSEHHGRVLAELCQDCDDDESPITWPRVGQVIYRVRGRSVR